MVVGLWPRGGSKAAKSEPVGGMEEGSSAGEGEDGARLASEAVLAVAVLEDERSGSTFKDIPSRGTFKLRLI